MSISKIINQVKQGYSTVPVSTKSTNATSINLDTSVPDSNKLQVEVSSPNVRPSNVPVSKHSNLLSKYQEKQDDWNDLEDISTKAINKLSTKLDNKISKSEEDTEGPLNMSKVEEELEEEDESWDDIEVPTGTLQLHLPTTTSTSIATDIDNKNDILSKYQDEEGSWEEISIPSKYHHSENTKVAAISKSSLNEDDEDWSGLEIPSTLQLKVPTSPLALNEPIVNEEEPKDSNEEEDWDDVVIPENFASKLQTKKPLY
jgi:hypothetical protein